MSRNGITDLIQRLQPARELVDHEAEALHDALKRKLELSAAYRLVIADLQERETRLFPRPAPERDSVAEMVALGALTSVAETAAPAPVP